MKQIPYSMQLIEEDDIRAVVKVLQSPYLTQGPLVAEFEEKLADYCGAKYAVAVSNGTAALHLACLAAEIKPGDEIITSPITFAASANCALYCGARPVFADIDEKTANISPEEIQKKINQKTKALIPVHFAGQPCDLKEIKLLAEKNNLLIIEDAAHALGADYDGEKIGGCKYSDMSTFSFHAIKSITTGEGGAILTNQEGLCQKLRKLRTHGITKENPGPGFWYYEMQALGFNYRLTDIQAALGISQLGKIDQFIKRRKEIFQKYCRAFAGIPWLKLLEALPDRNSAHHLFVILIDFQVLGLSRKEVMEKLLAKGISTQVHYIPVYLHPYYRVNFGYQLGAFPRAENYYRQALSLPLFPSLLETDVQRIINEILELADA